MQLGLIKKVYAQNVDTSLVKNPLADKYTTIAEILTLVTNIVIGVGVALTIIFLVIGGIKYITSQGDPKAADAARGALTNAVIGFVIVLAALAIRFLIQNVIGGNDPDVTNVTPGIGGGDGGDPVDIDPPEF